MNLAREEAIRAATQAEDRENDSELKRCEKIKQFRKRK